MKTPTRRGPITILLILALAALPACDSTDDDGNGGNPPATPQSTDSLSAATDGDLYLALAIATAVFDNASNDTVYLGGCAQFGIERRLDGIWMDVGPPFLCVWPGFASPVEPDEFVETDFDVPSDSGLYRLRYDFGEDCDPRQPLGPASCARTGSVYSNTFEVVREMCDRDAPGCQFRPGMPTLLCRDGVSASGPDDFCTFDPTTGRCGYEILSCP
jgi:hypothetical protein